MAFIGFNHVCCDCDLGVGTKPVAYESAFLLDPVGGDEIDWFVLDNATICFYASQYKNGESIFERMDHSGNTMMNDGDCGIPEGQLEDYNCFGLVKELVGAQPDAPDLFSLEGTRTKITG